MADTITVDLKTITKFAGLSILGGAKTDSVTIGPGGVSFATQGEGVMHGIQLASDVTTARGSQVFGGGVTLVNGVALQAGGDISCSSTIDGFGRLRIAAGHAITMAGDVGRV